MLQRIIASVILITFAIGGAQGALSVQITSVTPDSPLTANDTVSFTIGVTTSESAWVYAVFRLTINGVVKEFPTDYYTSRIEKTGRLETTFTMPPLVCAETRGVVCKDLAPAASISGALVRVEKMDVLLVAKQSVGSETARSVAFPLQVRYPSAEVLSGGGNRPLQSVQPLQFRLVGAQNPSSLVLWLVKNRNATECSAAAIYSYGSWNCMLYVQSSSAASGFKQLGGDVYQVDVSALVYPNKTNGSEDDLPALFSGGYDFWLKWRESQGSGFRNPHEMEVVLPNAVTITAPEAREQIRLSKVRLAIRAGLYTKDVEFTPGGPDQPEYLDPPAGATVYVLPSGTYRLDRTTHALLFPTMTNASDTQLQVQTLVPLPNTNQAFAPLLREGEQINVSLKLPATASDRLALRFTMAKPDQAVTSGSVLDRVLYQTAPVIFKWGKPPGVAIDHIEVVQVVQDPRNSVPLIARKKTIARVFVKSTGSEPARNVVGELSAFIRTEAGESPVSGKPLFISANAVHAFPADQAGRNDALAFELPENWTVAGAAPITLRARVWLRDAPDAPSGNESTKETTVRFEYSKYPKVFSIGYLPFSLSVTLPNGEATLLTPSQQIQSMHQFLAATLPIQEGGISYFPLPVSESALPDSMKSLGTLPRLFYLMHMSAPGWMHMLVGWHPRAELERATGSSFDFWNESVLRARATDDEDPVENYLLSPVPFLPDFTQPVTRVGDKNSSGGAPGESRARAMVKFAHTIGHSLGTEFMPGDCLTGEYGYNSFLRRLSLPASDNVFACGCFDDEHYAQDGVGVSVNSYKRLIDTPYFVRLAVLLGDGAPAAKARDAEAASDFLLVSGRIRAGGASAEFDTPVRMPSSMKPLPGDPKGNYCLALSGEGGELSRLCFRSANAPAEVQEFSYPVAMPAGAKRLSLKRGDQELASIDSSAGTPSIEITSPAAGSRAEGRVTLTWAASGADTFTVLYSGDGGSSWVPLATGVRDRQYTAATSVLTGGPSIHFQVIGSSGLSSAAAKIGPIEVVQSPKVASVDAAVDFPNLQSGKDAERAVNISAAGTGPLTLAIEPIEDPNFLFTGGRQITLLPGGKLALPVLFQPLSPGAKTGVLRIHTNDPAQPDIEVKLSGSAFGFAAPSLEIAPQGLSLGTSREGRFNVLNTGNAPLTVSSIMPGAVGVSVSPSSFVVAPGEAAAVSVTLGPLVTGAVDTSLVIASDDPSRPSTTLRLVAAAPVTVAVSPTSLDFGSVTVGQSKDLTLNVTGGTVTGASSNNTAFTVSSRTATTAVVRFAPTAAGAQSGSLNITTSGGNITVALRGTATAPSVTITLSPAALDFGSVQVGQTKDLTVNVTGSPVTSAAASSPVFSIASRTATAVTVRFAPTAAGSQTATLTVTTSAGTATGSLSGIGVPVSAAGPVVESISPSSAEAGRAGFTLTVNGSNFVQTSAVRWNGSNRATTFVSSRLLTAAITAADIAAAGTARVTVDSSNALVFTISAPPANSPAIVGMLTPTQVPAGTPAFTLTVGGSRFVRGAVVKWDGSPRTTTWISSNEMQASIGAGDVTGAKAVSVAVENPGAVTSNSAPFTVAPAGAGVLINQIDASSCSVIKLFATVSDRNGNAVAGLSDANLRCQEDGSPMACGVSNAAEAGDLSLMLVLDTTTAAFESERAAARYLISGLAADDRVALVTTGAPAGFAQGFSNDKTRVLGALDRLTQGGTKSALYDAIGLASQNLSIQRGRRRVLVVLAASGNSAGDVTDPAAVLASLRVAGAPVFSIVSGATPGLQTFLAQMALDTYAQSYAANASFDLAMQQLAGLVWNQYQLTYAPGPATDKPRLAGVTLKSSAGEASASRGFARCGQ